MDLTPIKLATQCPHPDRPLKAKGMCQPCYRAAKRAEELQSGKVKLDEEKGVDVKTGAPVELDLVNDPEAVKEFYGILWGWLRDSQKAEQPIITLDEKKKPHRDFKLEARLRESTDQRAMKAASVLGRAYIAERHIEDKPAELPVAGMGEMIGGWMQVATMKDGKKQDA